MNKKILFIISASLCYTLGHGQNTENFSYFKGDTLAGFDIEAAKQDALRNHCHGKETGNFIRLKERAFVAAKYNMPWLIKRRPSPTIPTILNGPCNNVDFESGTFTGWTGAVGSNNSSTAALTVLSAGISTLGINSAETSCSYHTLVTAAAGNDPYSGQPMLDPAGGNYAVRLGGEYLNYDGTFPCNTGDPNTFASGGEFLQQTFLVTPGNALFTYSYSVVMDQVTHLANQQPYFRVEVLDSAGNITNPCQQYYVIADPSGATPPGFMFSSSLDNSGNSVYYQPWTSNALNLSTYLGHPVTVRFTAAGCTLGGHFCYAYIDASCGPISITPNHPHVCSGQNDTLTAPGSGGVGSYVWSTLPSGNSGIVGSTTNQTVVVNANGTYQVIITYPNGCNYTIDTTITFHSLIASTAPTSATCNGLHNGSATVTPSGGVAPYSYSWSPAPGGGQGTSSVTGLAAGTYTVDITDKNGCTAATTVAVTQPAVLAAPGTPTAVACNGGSTGANAVTPTGGTTAYTYSWTPGGGTTQSISNVPAGIYTCLVTDAHGCTTTLVDTIKQPAVLTATPGVLNVSCNGGNTGVDSVIVAGGTSLFSYSWSPSGGNASKATGLSSGTYTCTVTDSHGCVTSATSTITQAPPIVYSTSSVPTPCGGHTGSASVNASGGTGSLSYSWAPVAGSTNSVTVVTAGIYTVTISDANNCQKVVPVPVSNTGGPNETLAHNHNVVCFGGSSGSIGVTGSGGTGTLTYSWSPAGGTGVTDTVTNNLPAGDYLITVVDASGCQVTLADTVFQPAQVSAGNTVTNVSCFGGSNGQIALTTTGGNPGGYAYTWSPSGGTSATANGLTIGTYTCAITDTKGCTGSATATITQPAVLAVSDTTFSISCFGGNNGSATVTPSGGTPGYNYTWSPVAGSTPGLSGLTAGKYTCTVSDTKGCIKIMTLIVNQPSAVTGINTPVPVSCNGGSNGSATIIPSGGTPSYTYLWSPTGGSAATASGFAAGTYTCTVTDSHGCKLTSPVTVTQPAVLTAPVTSNPVTCNGLSNGSATATPAGGNGGYTYSWSPSGGSANIATGLNANTYTCLVTDSKGCTISSVVTVTQPTAVVPTVNTATEKCFGGATVSDTIHATGGTGAYTYSWTPSGGAAAIANGLAAGTYTCSVTDANGCVKTQTVTITQPSAVTGTPSTTPAICLSTNGTASIVANGGNGPYTYSWSPGNATTSSISGLATGTYSCSITDNNGCKVTIPVTVVHGSNAITASFVANPKTGYPPLPVGFTDASSPSAVSWMWNFGDGATSNKQNPSATFTSAGTYTVSETVTDANGCDSTFSDVIIVKDPVSSLSVPNIFTPNGDGENDEFKVTYTALDGFDLKIYDRWGVLMAHFTHPWLGWDGKTFQGAMAADGTYYYIIAATGLDGKQYTPTGYFMLRH